MYVRAVDGVGTRATPCDCAPPDCANAPTARLNVSARATGLCYLYADARAPAFQHFRALGYDCLGQGGNDPLSHTLRQIRTSMQQPQRPHGSTNATNDDAPYWAIFNDQLNGIAKHYAPPHVRSGAVCGGGDLFSAHAKGAVGFRADSGGFFLQTSTPNFPDPTPPTALANECEGGHDDSDFVRLGCQVDNNVQFAQHAFAMSLAMPQLEALGAQLQAARLCSGNFYRGGNSTSSSSTGSTEREALAPLLASAALYRDGANASANRNFSALFAALLDPTLPEHAQPAALNLTLKQPLVAAARTSAVYVERHTESLAALNSALAESATMAPVSVHALVKSARTAVPPWTLVAESLASDLSVASWWDGGYGVPNVCAGDDFSRTPDRFCLDARALHANGSARFNLENLLEASWRMAGNAATTERSSGADNATLTWHLVGGNMRDGNHAKWSLTTPRDGIQDPMRAAVTFADLNMQGFPCSRACNGSQAGRGGAFFSLHIAALHTSLAQRVVKRACRCVGARPDRAGAQFADVRMCRFGCWRKVDARFAGDELPLLAPNATSFWDA